MPTIIITLPILFFASRAFFRWMKWKNDQMIHIPYYHSKYLSLHAFVIILMIVVLSAILDFNRYWYLFGLISLVVSVRYGFGATSLVNLFILLVIYFVPASVYGQTTNLYFDQNELLEIYLGINLLSLFSIISGRVISDYRQSQNGLRIQMEKVEKMNKELDRFVYSVSHDLIAPLKSIKGLINLIKTDKETSHAEEYISRIEESADKLDEFIGEILDYSRSTRKEVTRSKVNLDKMIRDIIDNHRFIQGFDHLQFDLSGLDTKQLDVDEMRLRIIINNLVSNAIKFSGDNPKAKICFTSTTQHGQFTITVEDNGSGIPEEIKENIFDMFFRASHKNSGSGLGLFIASEAAKSIDGLLTVESWEGEGSKFILTIPG
jgi:signal transduction histidine kinase